MNGKFSLLRFPFFLSICEPNNCKLVPVNCSTCESTCESSIAIKRNTSKTNMYYQENSQLGYLEKRVILRLSKMNLRCFENVILWKLKFLSVFYVFYFFVTREQIVYPCTLVSECFTGCGEREGGKHEWCTDMEKTRRYLERINKKEEMKTKA